MTGQRHTRDTPSMQRGDGFLNQLWCLLCGPQCGSAGWMVKGPGTVASEAISAALAATTIFATAVLPTAYRHQLHQYKEKHAEE